MANTTIQPTPSERSSPIVPSLVGRENALNPENQSNPILVASPRISSVPTTMTANSISSGGVIGPVIYRLILK